MEIDSDPEANHQPPKKAKINDHMEEIPSSSSSSTTYGQDLDPLIFQNIPQEFLVEILSRLPVKSLAKFKCVSRTWLSLISSSQFIKTHLKISSNKDDVSNHGLICTVLPPNSHSYLKQCSLESALKGIPSTDEVIDIDYPVKNPLKSVWVVGSCNGLVCISIDENDLFLWNPCIRKSKKLPDMGVKKLKNGCFLIFGFGYDELNDDYKVVGIFCVFSSPAVCETKVKVYSLKTDSWNRIEDFTGGIPLVDSGKYANGKLHWAAGVVTDWKFFSLDLGNETYGELRRPDGSEGLYDWFIGVLGGNLCVLYDYEKNYADVWVMKEYGIVDSWTKVVSVPYLNSPDKSRYSIPVCLLREGEILLVFGSGLVHYDPKSNTFSYPQIDKLEEVTMYVESLVLPSACDGEQRLPQ